MNEATFINSCLSQQEGLRKEWGYCFLNSAHHPIKPLLLENWAPIFAQVEMVARLGNLIPLRLVQRKQNEWLVGGGRGEPSNLEFPCWPQEN